MNVTLIYLNQKPVERQVKRVARQVLAQKLDLSNGGIAHQPFFNVIKSWPSQQALDTLPLQYQCEEVTLKNNKIVSLRKIVVDIDSSLISQLLLTDKTA